MEKEKEHLLPLPLLTGFQEPKQIKKNNSLVPLNADLFLVMVFQGCCH